MNTTTTITLFDVEFTVTYDYYPPEPQTYTDPGWGAEVDISQITINGSPDLIEFLSEYTLNRIEEHLIHYHEPTFQP